MLNYFRTIGLPSTFWNLKIADLELMNQDWNEGRGRQHYFAVPCDQEDHVDDALYNQIRVASCSQALVLIRHFKHTGISWKDNKEGHKHFRRFLECCDENVFLWVIEKPTRRGGMPDLALTSMERLVGNVKLKNGLVTMKWWSRSLWQWGEHTASEES